MCFNFLSEIAKNFKMTESKKIKQRAMAHNKRLL